MRLAARARRQRVRTHSNASRSNRHHFRLTATLARVAQRAHNFQRRASSTHIRRRALRRGRARTRTPPWPGRTARCPARPGPRRRPRARVSQRGRTHTAGGRSRSARFSKARSPREGFASPARRGAERAEAGGAVRPPRPRGGLLQLWRRALGDGDAAAAGEAAGKAAQKALDAGLSPEAAAAAGEAAGDAIIAGKSPEVAAAAGEAAGKAAQAALDAQTTSGATPLHAWPPWVGRFTASTCWDSERPTSPSVR
mgnify:CR=1 FL=1